MEVPTSLRSRFPWLAASWAEGRFRRGAYAAAAVWAGDALLAVVLADEDTPSHILLGPPFASQDGEYHAPLVDYVAVVERLEDLEEPVREKISAVLGEVFADEALRVEAFARTPVLASALAETIEASLGSWMGMLVPVAVAWAKAIFPPNLHLASAEAYRDIGSTSSEQFSAEEIATLHGFYGTFVLKRTSFGAENASLSFYSASVGAKLIPLTVGEVVNVGSVRFMLWREMFADYLGAKLVFNFVTDAFPMFGQWALVLGSGPGLYAAAHQHERFGRAPIITEVREHLSESERILKDIGTAGRAAAAHAHKAVQDIDSRLDLTDISMVKTAEHVGWTLAHVVLKLDTAAGARTTLFSDPKMFEPLVFGWLYGLHVLHTRMAVLHSDLHANNIAVNWTRYHTPSDADKLPGVETYIIRGDTFVVPFNGIRAHIIDFSRGIIGGLTDLRARYGAEIDDEFLAKQVPALSRLVERAHPGFASRLAGAFAGAAHMNFDGAAGVCTALDVVVMARAIGYAADAAAGNAGELKKLAAKLEVAASLAFESAAQAFLDAPLAAVPIGSTHVAADLCADLFPHFKGGDSSQAKQTWTDDLPQPVEPDDPASWSPALLGFLSEDRAAQKKIIGKMDRHAKNTAVKHLREAAAERRGHTAAAAASTGSWII